MLDSVSLAATVQFQFFTGSSQKPELDLLCSKLQKYLFDAFVYPLILPAPHQVYVVGHDNEPIQPNPFIIHHKF
jgi:hypothetical protein